MKSPKKFDRKLTSVTYTIEAKITIDPTEPELISEVLDKCREYGSAEIVDITGSFEPKEE